jgi:hypothetical protein
VILSFGITSLISIVLAMPVMIVGFLDLQPSSSESFNSSTPSSNRLLRLLKIRTPSQQNKFKKHVLEFVEKISLGLSDQQLITGIAMLIVGYTRHCSISSRHFWIVFDLAFFSAVTHLSSLPALRRYFSKNKRLRDLRVFLMLCNYIMLLVAAILTFRDYNPITKNCPIRCTFDQIRTKHFGVSGIYTSQMVLLTLVFFWQLVMLYMSPDAWDTRHEMILRGVRGQGPLLEMYRNSYEKFLEKRKKQFEQLGGERSGVEVVKDILKLRHLRRQIYRSLRFINDRYRDSKPYRFTQWVVVMLVAPPAAVVWLVILTLFGQGVGRLVSDRQSSVGAENTWSFGQVLPMMIVVLPFLTVLEVLQGKGCHKYISIGYMVERRNANRLI